MINWVKRKNEAKTLKASKAATFRTISAFCKSDLFNVKNIE